MFISLEPNRIQIRIQVYSIESGPYKFKPNLTYLYLKHGSKQIKSASENTMTQLDSLSM